MNTIPTQSSRSTGHEDENPYRAPVTMHEPVRDRVRADKWFRLAVGLQCLTIVVGVMAAFVDIESIIVTGIVITPLGFIVTLLSWRHSRNNKGLSLLFGLSGPAISLFCFLLIYRTQWSPTEAQRPVSLIVLLYGIFALLPGFWSLNERSESRSPSEGLDLTNASES